MTTEQQGRSVRGLFEDISRIDIDIILDRWKYSVCITANQRKTLLYYEYEDAGGKAAAQHSVLLVNLLSAHKQ